MPVGDLLPEIAVLVGATLLLVLASLAPARHQPLGAALALAALGVAAAFAAAGGGAARLTFSGTFALDEGTTATRLLVLAATAVVVLLSPEWMRTDRRHGEYYAVLLFAALGAMLLGGASDTLELVVAVLLSSVTGYTLAAYHRRSAPSVEAGMKYFLVGALANVLLLVGVTLLYGLAGTTRYAPTARALEGADPAAATAAVGLVVVGVGFKLAALPAHAWMPDVAQGAPAPAAAFLTVVPKVGATVALARFLQIVPTATVPWRPLLAVLAAATMTAGTLAALRQEDLRRLLGWSTVAQSGYVLMAVAVLGRSGRAVPALLLFLVAYAAANLAAFGAVVELRGRTALADYRGLAWERPLVTAVLVVALLSLVGIPPLAGFAGKLLLFVAAIEGGLAWLAAVAVANTVASLFYTLRVLGPAAFEAAGPAPVAVLGRWALGGALLAGLATLAVGLAAGPLLEALAGARLLP